MKINKLFWTFKTDIMFVKQINLPQIWKLSTPTVRKFLNWKKKKEDISNIIQ